MSSVNTGGQRATLSAPLITHSGCPVKVTLGKSAGSGGDSRERETPVTLSLGNARDSRGTALYGYCRGCQPAWWDTWDRCPAEAGPRTDTDDQVTVGCGGHKPTGTDGSSIQGPMSQELPPSSSPSGDWLPEKSSSASVSLFLQWRVGWPVVGWFRLAGFPASLVPWPGGLEALLIHSCSPLPANCPKALDAGDSFPQP